MGAAPAGRWGSVVLTTFAGFLPHLCPRPDTLLEVTGFWSPSWAGQLFWPSALEREKSLLGPAPLSCDVGTNVYNDA